MGRSGVFEPVSEEEKRRGGGADIGWDLTLTDWPSLLVT
jgi:hypothetical protein